MNKITEKEEKNSKTLATDGANKKQKKLEIGDKAPAFRAHIEVGKRISLAELAGKYVVLYFYPKDDTPGCTIEAKDFTELKSDFRNAGAVVIGVSKDTIGSHEKFKDKYSLAIDLISDPEGTICDDYGVWIQKSMFGKKYLGIQRSTYLIDPHGNIAHIWPKVSVSQHAAQVLEKLKEISNKR